MRLFRDVTEGAGLRTRTEQSTLRSGQEFDPVHVDIADADLLRIRCHRLLVKIDSDLRFPRVLEHFACHAADSQLILPRLQSGEVDARQGTERSLEILRTHTVELDCRQYVDAVWNILQTHFTPGGSYDDLFKACRFFLCQHR